MVEAASRAMKKMLVAEVGDVISSFVLDRPRGRSGAAMSGWPGASSAHRRKLPLAWRRPAARLSSPALSCSTD
eukprot:2683820-Pyramimonas_sp.AAC.1